MRPSEAELLTHLIQPDLCVDEASDDGAIALQRVSRVQRIEGDRLIVSDGQRSRALGRAASCILEPAPGDRVAWLDLGEPGGYLVAVLERSATSPQRWHAPGGVEWRTAQLTLRCGASLHVETPQLEIDSPQLSLRTQHASIVYEVLESIGRKLSVTAQGVQLVGFELSTVFDRVTQFAQRHLRTVEGTDQLSAGTIDYRADTLLHLQAENVLANGDRLVKVKGAQIHLG
jgi:hypothetical protein